LEVEREHRKVQPGGGRGHRERVRRADVRAEFLLEALDNRTRGDPAGAEAANDLVDFLFTDRRPRERNDTACGRGCGRAPNRSTNATIHSPHATHYARTFCRLHEGLFIIATSVQL